MISYAQNFEDVLLERVFRDRTDGFYVDVGAHDPEYLSVTKHFYDKGWCGINIEPVPASHDKFLAKRPRDINLAVAVGREEGERELFVLSDSALSTFNRSIADHSACITNDHCVQTIVVPVCTLDAILKDAGISQIDFLKIDVEGAEREVLEGIDLARFRPVMIVVEATGPMSEYDYANPERILVHGEWEHLLVRRGYRPVFFDGLNRFYLREENPELEGYFGIPVGPVRDHFRLSADEKAHADLQERLRGLERTAEGVHFALGADEKAHADLERPPRDALAAWEASAAEAKALHERVQDLERTVEGLHLALVAREKAHTDLEERLQDLERVTVGLRFAALAREKIIEDLGRPKTVRRARRIWLTRSFDGHG
jgi:FkbM family methyltransferase